MPAQLIVFAIATAVAMTMVVMVPSEADVTHQQSAQHQQSHCLPKGERRQSEDCRHQLVPKPHHTTSEQGKGPDKE